MSEPDFKPTKALFTVLVCIVRKPGTSFEQFKTYYEDQHTEFGMRIMKKGGHLPLTYTRHFIDRDALASTPLAHNSSFEYDCITRFEYESKEVFEAGLKNIAEHQQEIAEDEEKFMDRSKTVVVVPGESPSHVTK